MKKISIIIPAHNEADRIDKTLRTYHQYFKVLKDQEVVDFEFLVVLNGCTDNTFDVVREIQENAGDEIHILDLQQAGKGIAIIAGFENALKRNNDYIGFVDADMATEPQYFFDLYRNMHDHDGVIASRYLPESQVTPARPWIKEKGRKYIYNFFVRTLFGINFADYQCGAKLFKRAVIEAIINDMQEGQWAFDVEVLYLAKKHGFDVIEIPTVWNDKAGSKLDIMGGGIRMLKALFELKRVHSGEGNEKKRD